MASLRFLLNTKYNILKKPFKKNPLGIKKKKKKKKKKNKTKPSHPHTI